MRSLVKRVKRKTSETANDRKLEIGYYRTPTGCSVIQSDLNLAQYTAIFVLCSSAIDATGNENVLVFFFKFSIQLQ